jgi:hypothetical protein
MCCVMSKVGGGGCFARHKHDCALNRYGWGLSWHIDFFVLCGLCIGSCQYGGYQTFAPITLTEVIVGKLGLIFVKESTFYIALTRTKFVLFSLFSSTQNNACSNCKKPNA